MGNVGRLGRPSGYGTEARAHPTRERMTRRFARRNDPVSRLQQCRQCLRRPSLRRRWVDRDMNHLRLKVRDTLGDGLDRTEMLLLFEGS